MSEHRIIEAVKQGDLAELRGLLAAGGDANETDEQGWTPLNWAAGRGDPEIVRQLLEHGADPTATGRDDRRTPLMIAKAAQHAEVAALLAEEEKRRGVWADPAKSSAYCRAYYLRDLRKFPGWSESRINWKEEDVQGGDGQAASGLTGDDVAYLHQDLTVTRSMWPDESVIFRQITPEWEEFCRRELGFALPEDIL